MSLGLKIFTLVHVLISLAGIFSGLVVLFGLLKGQRLDKWTAVFLATTVLTSVTGFFFPVQHLMPSHVVGILSLIVLAIAIYARYRTRLAGAWRKTYVICSMIALWFNVFVAIVQSFEKIPALHAIAPAQTDPPFKFTQLIVSALFAVLTVIACFKFRDSTIMQTSPAT